jgi:cell division GTPase FtsZ
MPSVMFTVSRPHHAKRSLLRWNFGGQEVNHVIEGDNNNLSSYADSKKPGQDTLIRKAGNEIGRVLEGATDVVVAPAKWLSHMQDNW